MIERKIPLPQRALKNNSEENLDMGRTYTNLWDVTICDANHTIFPFNPSFILDSTSFWFTEYLRHSHAWTLKNSYQVAMKLNSLIMFGSRFICSDVSVINSAHTMQLASSITFRISWLHRLQLKSCDPQTFSTHLSFTLTDAGWWFPLQIFSMLFATSFVPVLLNKCHQVTRDCLEHSGSQGELSLCWCFLSLL